MQARKPVHYCSVYGCLNTKRDDSRSFFKLPTNSERRIDWLKRIDREDLLNMTDLKPDSYRVCSVHFEESMMTSVLTRKLLPEAVPTKFLTKLSKSNDENEETKDSEDSDVNKNGSETTTGTQTEIPVKEQTGQNSIVPSYTPRERQLIAQLQESRLKKRRLQSELNKLKQEIEAKNSLSLCSKCKTSL